MHEAVDRVMVEVMSTVSHCGDPTSIPDQFMSDIPVFLNLRETAAR